ncbi:hypothetical protein OV320_0138 [Actinobacteria bacterium OV320]|nr:hypothetical protein OV320_0138 [Actinobacteria bacterium OV320]
MIAPMTRWRTAVRTTAVVTLTAGLLLPGVTSAQAAAPAPSVTSSDPVSSLLGQVTNVLANTLNGSALRGSPASILPNGILGG